MSRLISVSVFDPEDNAEWSGWHERSDKPGQPHQICLARNTQITRSFSSTPLNDFILNGFYDLQKPMAAIDWNTTSHRIGGGGPNHVRTMESAEGTCEAILVGDNYNLLEPTRYRSVSAEYPGLMSMLHREVLRDSSERELFSFELDEGARAVCKVQQSSTWSMTERRVRATVRLNVDFSDDEGINALQALNQHR
jgi:hypothetical protein